MKAAVSATLLPLFTGEPNLLRQRVQVNEQKVCQALHSPGQFFRSLSRSMESLISIKTELMSPFLQSWSDSVFRSKFVNSLLQLPRINVGSKLLKCHFHATPQHPGRRGPVSTMEIIASFHVELCNALRSECGSSWRGCGWLYAKNIGVVTEITFRILEAYVLPWAALDQYRTKTLGTCIRCIANSSPRVLINTFEGKPETIPTAPRAIVNEDRHVYS